MSDQFTEVFSGVPTHLAGDENAWNAYWNKKNRGGLIYAAIAEFYRIRIIRPTLNYFIRRYFPKGANLLHAGCGSGQVDTDLAFEYHITGMDISSRALELYRRSNPVGQTLLSSIFDIKLPESSIDGIFNLGVMEHFTESEIHHTLLQFKKVLKPDGYIVLFWPPEFGLSVLFFKLLTGVTRLLLRKTVKFHPDEISRISSQEWVKALLEKAGFEIVQYSFSIRDAFTYSVVVGRKAS